MLTIGQSANHPTDPFLQYAYQTAVSFNKKHKGRIRLKILPSITSGGDPEDQQYYRLALSGSLPDIFRQPTPVLKKLAVIGGGGKLADLRSGLGRDKVWMNSFHRGVFDDLRGPRGGILGIPDQRDVIGIFYNKELFRKAGIATFPTTWTAFDQACAKLKAAGVIPIAIDGEWSVWLWWVNRIGTQPGGAAWLRTGLKQGELDNPIVVRATEWLKLLHTSACVNKDPFTGFANADALFVRGEAAMLANGPWEVPVGIKGASAAPGLYGKVGYAQSPGNGMIVTSGGGGWAVGAKTPEKRAAALEYLKFVTARAQAYRRVVKTGSYPAVKLNLTAAQRRSLEPLALGLVEKSATVKYTYPIVHQAAPPSFIPAWKNYWPAYVQGELTTSEFLARLSEAVKKGS